MLPKLSSWQRDGQRISCKGAQLTWEASRRYWSLMFNNVKLAYGDAAAAFDELLLAAYTPRGVYVYRKISNVISTL